MIGVYRLQIRIQRFIQQTSLLGAVALGLGDELQALEQRVLVGELVDEGLLVPDLGPTGYEGSSGSTLETEPSDLNSLDIYCAFVQHTDKKGTVSLWLISIKACGLMTFCHGRSNFVFRI